MRRNKQKVSKIQTIPQGIELQVQDVTKQKPQIIEPMQKRVVRPKFKNDNYTSFQRAYCCTPILIKKESFISDEMVQDEILENLFMPVTPGLSSICFDEGAFENIEDFDDFQNSENAIYPMVALKLPASASIIDDKSKSQEKAKSVLHLLDDMENVGLIDLQISDDETTDAKSEMSADTETDKSREVCGFQLISEKFDSVGAKSKKSQMSQSQSQSQSKSQSGFVKI